MGFIKRKHILYWMSQSFLWLLSCLFLALYLLSTLFDDDFRVGVKCIWLQSVPNGLFPYPAAPSFEISYPCLWKTSLNITSKRVRRFIFWSLRIKIERHPVCHIKMIDSDGSWIHQKNTNQTCRSGGKYIIYFVLFVEAEYLVMI